MWGIGRPTTRIIVAIMLAIATAAGGGGCRPPKPVVRSASCAVAQIAVGVSEHYVPITDPQSLQTLRSLFPLEALTRKTNAEAGFLPAYYLTLVYDDGTTIGMDLDDSLTVFRTRNGCAPADPRIKNVILNALPPPPPAPPPAPPAATTKATRPRHINADGLPEVF